MRLAALVTAAALSGLVHAKNFTQGFDISSADSEVDFEGAYESGARFVSIRVTEGAKTTDELASTYWQEARDAGLFTQALHRADPRQSSGKEQLDFLLNNGGDWHSGNGSLAGGLEIIPNPDPNGDPCYGLESDELADWIFAFGDGYFTKYHAYSTLRVNPDWWDKCTYIQDLGNMVVEMDFGVIDYESDSIPEWYPEHWVWKYWENAPHYKFGGKSAVFYDNYEELKRHTSGSVVYCGVC